MTFLNPFLLIALAAAAIPLIIHLINFRRPRKIDFSSLAFLHELRQRTMRRLKIKQWLLLALRTLAVVCLVLAFARPTVTGDLFQRLGRVSVSAVVILDNSLSMTQRDAEGDYLSQAREVAAGLPDQLNTITEIAVVPLVGEGGRSYYDPSIISAQLNDISAAPGRVSLGARMDDLGDLLQRATHPARAVFIISDLQHTTFADSLAPGLPESADIFLVPVGENTEENVAVTGVEVISSVIEAGRPVRLRATVEHFGRSPRQTVSVGVNVGGERVSSGTVDLPARGSATAELTFTPARRGWLAGKITIEDDAYSFDNERHFTLLVPENRRVLLLSDAEPAANFVRLALSASLDSGSAPFTVDNFSSANFATVSATSHNAVIVIGPMELSDPQVSAILNYVEEGGGLLLFAGSQDGSTSEVLAALDAGSLVRKVGPDPIGTPVSSLRRVDLEHPIFDGMFTTADEVKLEEVSLYQLLELRPEGVGGNTIAVTTTGSPFLHEVERAGSRLLVMPFVPDQTWTDLPLRGLFVPLMHRSLLYLTSPVESSTRSIISGSGGAFPVSIRQGETQTVIRSSEGEEWIPEQRPTQNGLIVSVPEDVTVPGAYGIFVDDSLQTLFAVNHHGAEGDLRRMDPDDAAARLQKAVGREVSVISPARLAAATRGSSGDSPIGIEIWNVFLVLALLFLVTEMLLAARWKPSASLQ